MFMVHATWQVMWFNTLDNTWNLFPDSVYLADLSMGMATIPTSLSDLPEFGWTFALMLDERNVTTTPAVAVRTTTPVPNPTPARRDDITTNPAGTLLPPPPSSVSSLMPTEKIIVIVTSVVGSLVVMVLLGAILHCC
jgi:hypothetical protein